MTRRCVEGWPMCTNTQLGHRHEGCADCGAQAHEAGSDLCVVGLVRAQVELNAERSRLMHSIMDSYPKEVS